MNFLYVALGSAVGGVARWSIGGWLQRLAGGAPPQVFPVSTLVINASGSFVLGVLAVLMARQGGAQDGALRLLLAVGFCGGYTTFSTFSLDTVALMETRGMGVALLNVVGSVGLGVLGVVVGMGVGKAVLR